MGNEYNYLHCIKTITLQPRILYSEKLFFRDMNEVKIFSDNKKQIKTEFKIKILLTKGNSKGQTLHRRKISPEARFEIQ